MKKLGIVLFIAIVAAIAGPSGAQVAIEPEGMMATLTYLADEKFRGRGVGSTELDQVAAFIATKFESVGLLPGGEPSGSWYQEWVDPDRSMRMRNVVGILPGRNPELARESVVIGAHYDHLGMKGTSQESAGKVHPGADDNASGVAVLLEMASRLTLVANMERSVVFVAFTGEEAGRKGSRYYVQNEKRYPVSRTVGMINLDTVGRLGRNKLIVLNAGSAKEWADLLKEAGKKVGLEVAPSMQDLDSSDQKSFHEAGVPAVQLFTGPHLDYHRPTDTADKIDGQGLVKIATVTRAVAFYLANQPAPLTRTIAAAPGPVPAAPRSDRKVTIGVIPDFSYNEKGVRLGGAQPGGPAEAAGLKQGDIIIQAGTTPIEVLKDLSDVLKTKQPGDKLPVRFLRNGTEYRAMIDVREK